MHAKHTLKMSEIKDGKLIYTCSCGKEIDKLAVLIEHQRTGK